jgi:shikimate dehydrogenase
MKLPEKATYPTMYFVGVTTTKSAIMKLFPLWINELGFNDAVIKGIDVAIHAPEEDYRKVVEFIKNDELSLGALVTTHKIDLFKAANNYFEYLDPYVKAFGEISSISKKSGKLEGYAKDPISSGFAMEAFIPNNFWKDHGGEALILGAGGASIAIAAYLMREEHRDNVPSKIIISNRSQARLDEAKEKIGNLKSKIKVEYYLCPNCEQQDELLKNLMPYSLIVNGTGLGKDRPGSPLTDDCAFPMNSLVWELNYRGTLEFMHQAEMQGEERNLYIEDGWIYFIHGWTQVISEVFHIDIKGKVLDRLMRIAEEFRPQ